jgi:hypothetical protein
MNYLTPTQTMNNQKEQPNIFDVLKNILLAAAIMLFFSGYNYLNFYFREFGLSINSISFEITSFYMYGFLLLSDGNNLLVTLFVFLSMPVLYMLREKIKNWLYVLFFIIMFLYFPIEYKIVEYLAHTNAEQKLQGKVKLYPVYFNFKKDFLGQAKRDSLGFKINSEELNKYDLESISIFRDLNRHNKLYMFYQSNENYYVFYNPNFPQRDLKKSIQVFVVPKDAANFTLLSIDKQIN